jgi:hypothetical protein
MMPTYRRKNNPITSIRLSPEEMQKMWEAGTRDAEARGRRLADDRAARYGIPLNRKRRAYR